MATDIRNLILNSNILESLGFKKDGYTNLSWDYRYEDKDISIYINLKTTCDKRNYLYIGTKDFPSPKDLCLSGRNIREVHLYDLESFNYS